MCAIFLIELKYVGKKRLIDAQKKFNGDDAIEKIPNAFNYPFNSPSTCDNRINLVRDHGEKNLNKINLPHNYLSYAFCAAKKFHSLIGVAV